MALTLMRNVYFNRVQQFLTQSLHTKTGIAITILLSNKRVACIFLKNHLVMSHLCAV